MIQRIQTLWLLVAGLLAILTFKFPFYNGSAELSAGYDIWTQLLTGALAAVVVFDIFLFKNRRLQFRLAILGLILSIGQIVVYFSKMKEFTNGHLSLTSLFSFTLPVVLFLAARGIWKDQKLIRSLDRLR